MKGTEIQESKNCIHSIPWECGKSCIGERGRPLTTRITKHAWNIKMGEITKSKLAEHSWDEKSKYNVTRQKYYAKLKTGLSENKKRDGLHQNRRPGDQPA